MEEPRYDDASAAKFRDALVDKLLAEKMITSPVVEQAFRTVPRHLFVAEGTPLDVVYDVDNSVPIKRDVDGVVVSSTSAAYITATGLEPLRFPYQLLETIGAYDTVWSADRRGHYVASALTQSTPRDWARIGLLMLHDGIWDGRRLLPPGWISLLTQPSPANPGYGGLTWLNTDNHHNGLPSDTYYAEGAFGQATYVIPSHDTVIATMGFAPTTPPAETATTILNGGIS